MKHLENLGQWSFYTVSTLWQPPFHLSHLCRFLTSRQYHQRLDELQTAAASEPHTSPRHPHRRHFPADISEIIPH